MLPVEYLGKGGNKWEYPYAHAREKVLLMEECL